MSKQDKLLLKEIKEILIKPLKISYQQFADEAIVQGAINQAEEILAKVKQRYEQKIAFAKEDGFDAGVGHKRKYGQKRLDRPKSCENCFYQGCGLKIDLREIAHHLYVKGKNKDKCFIQFCNSMAEHCSLWKEKDNE